MNPTEHKKPDSCRTSDLIGPALDWAVAKCKDKNATIKDGFVFASSYYPYAFAPSTNWAQAGPIIEREKLSIGWGIRTKDGGASTLDGKVSATGQTPLISAMRCFVASKLGDEIEIPKELTP